MPYMQRVAVQGPVEVRDAAGGADYTYEVITGMESVPALVLAGWREDRGERMVVTEGAYTVHLGGHFPDLTTDMVIIDGEAVYDIVDVKPTMRRRATVVLAHQVAI
jgi:hypothetical protein